VVKSIVDNYIALSQEETYAWQHEPETYIKKMDSENYNPDNIQPRATGIDLLICMVERDSSDCVAKVLTEMRKSLLLQPQMDPNVVLAKDSCYRAIGEVMAKVPDCIEPKGWFRNELRAMLASDLLARFPMSIMKARALWLTGIVVNQLPYRLWVQALELSIKNLHSDDGVVGLMAVTTLTALVSGAPSLLPPPPTMHTNAQTKHMPQHTQWRYQSS